MKYPFPAVGLPAGVLIAGILCAASGQSLSSFSSGSSSASLPQGTSMVAELAKSIDARKAKTGDTVKAKVVQDVIANGQVVVHRGSKLLGHVVEAKASGQEGLQSTLEVSFDRVDLKHGEEMSFHAVLLALAPHVQSIDVLSASSSVYGGGSSGGAQPVSHGAAKQVVVERRDRVDHTREDALQNAADPKSYGKQLNTLHNGFLDPGNRGVFGMPGLALKAVPGAHETELISTKEDIKLESGTQIVVGVMGNQ